MFQRCLEEHQSVLNQLDSLEADTSRAATILAQVVSDGKTILLAGNGGSASDAQHIAGEFVGRFLMERKGASAIALGASDASLTSIANDYGFEQVFSRQVEAYRHHAGALIAYSTSGNSPNILAAAQSARELGIKVIGMTGSSGGTLKALTDVCLCVPSNHTPRIQEIHSILGHILCEIVEPNLE
ncbi:MAG: SIS domain-containing protein [Chlorobia bacterium]|nr:SIS domain-containing protein [Fimbriimonadaceae bacterium]